MPRMPIRHRPLIVVDTETTGLDPDLHRVLEIGFCDEWGRPLYHRKIKPSKETLKHASPSALAINGYTEESWTLGVDSFEQVADDVFGLLTAGIIVGQNPHFDLGFLKKELRRVWENRGMAPSNIDKKLSQIGYHVKDTATLAMEHLLDLGLESLSLGPVCVFLGIEHGRAHTALADCVATAKVRQKILPAGPLQRLWWRLVGPMRQARAHRDSVEKKMARLRMDHHAYLNELKQVVA